MIIFCVRLSSKPIFYRTVYKTYPFYFLSYIQTYSNTAYCLIPHTVKIVENFESKEQDSRP